MFVFPLCSGRGQKFVCEHSEALEMSFKLQKHCFLLLLLCVLFLQRSVNFNVILFFSIQSSDIIITQVVLKKKRCKYWILTVCYRIDGFQTLSHNKSRRAKNNLKYHLVSYSASKHSIIFMTLVGFPLISAGGLRVRALHNQAWTWEMHGQDHAAQPQWWPWIR